MAGPCPKPLCNKGLGGRLASFLGLRTAAEGPLVGLMRHPGAAQTKRGDTPRGGERRKGHGRYYPRTRRTATGYRREYVGSGPMAEQAAQADRQRRQAQKE